MARRKFLVVAAFLSITCLTAAQEPGQDTNRLLQEILTRGQYELYLNRLSDDVGHRPTGTRNAERAEQLVLSWLRDLGLDNVHAEPFPMRARWERRSASLRLTQPYDRTLSATSYTWTPGTRKNGVEGPLVDAGGGKPEEIAAVRSQLRGAIALVVPTGVSLDEVIKHFYRTPGFVRQCAEAGALAVLIASDKERTLLYTAPVLFNAGISPLPTLSLAREDVLFLRRLLAQKNQVRLQAIVKNSIGPSFSAHNIVGEIRGWEKPEEVVLLGAHLDSNDLGPGALDNGAGCAALLETARAIGHQGIKPLRTLRFVFFMGEEEGMVGSTAYVKQHLDEMDRIMVTLIMDIGAGRPLGWFSMGRTDLDEELRAIAESLKSLRLSTIDHKAFAATDNAAFMAAGVPNLVLLQDDAAYFSVHHTTADTPDKAQPRDVALSVAALAATALKIAGQPARFGKRLGADEIEKMMKASGVESQWRDAGIWPLR